MSISIHSQIRSKLLRFVAHASAPSLGSDVFASLFIFGVSTRLYLGVRLFTEDIVPMSYVPHHREFWQGLRFFVWDFLFAFVLAVAVSSFARMTRNMAWRTLSRGSGWVVLSGVFITVGGLTGAHQDLLFETHAGMTLEVFLEAWSSGSVSDVYAYASRAAVVTTAAPIVLLLAARLQSAKARRIRGRLLSGLAAVTIALQLPSVLLWVTGNAPATPKFALRSVPVYFVVRDVLQTLVLPSGEMQTALTNVKLRRKVSTNAYSGDPFERSVPAPPTLLRIASGSSSELSRSSNKESARRWNVLFVLMESTGARYLAQATAQGERPMPFVHELMNQATTLEFHLATSNTSPRSIFSIFSGLYPPLDKYLFCTRKDVAVPGLGTFLGPDYDSFLVTPGRRQSYFPLAFMLRSVVHDVEDYSTIPPTNRPSWPGARHELDAVDSFLDRLERASEPFFAVYYSYAPHYRYHDYGPEYRIEEGDSPRSRYINNLRLLDTQIERIVGSLKESRRLDDTIVVLVGDHGEAFGQHEANFAHSRASYMENLHVPALLYQPKLFAPKRVTEVTSHVDLLPTLLDALQIPFVPEDLQGESLFRPTRQRYRFSVGNENALSSVACDGSKMLIEFKKDQCNVYDLNSDPLEHRGALCSKRPEQLEALLFFGKQQKHLIRRINADAREKLNEP